MRRKIPADPSRLAQSPSGTPLNSVQFALRSDAETSARTEFVTNNPPTFDWEQRGQIAARAYCRARGYSRAVNVATVPFTHTSSNPQGWGYTEDLDDRPNHYTFAAYQTRQWTATCEKKVRRRS